ncbi:hypothetical protein FJTKL_03974 [Diaporthe vaccinii]|uniref:Uncharacterized protein n=1 Tax=Diaporthe vaccinii TaxID=105482 RepID=A0ABR4F1Q4_9PEZI
MYNISSAFRTAEAQRVLPLLRHRFGEPTVRQVAQGCASYAASQNWQEPQPRLLYDVDPPTHESAVVKSRTQCEAIAEAMRSRGRLFDSHPDALGRVQWSALNIIGSFLTFDNGVPVELADYIGRALVPMLYPEGAFYNRQYRFRITIEADDGSRAFIGPTKFIDENFWNSYHDMIKNFEVLVHRNDEHKRDLNAIAVELETRMEDVRNTFHDLLVEERVAFHTIAKDLLPVTKHVPIEELERHPPASCTVCGLLFSQEVQEPSTPSVFDYGVYKERGQQVHSPMRYQECAYVPHQHAFCMREWARLLMEKDANNMVTGIKAKDHWRCNTCFVDPWRAG